MRRRPRATLSVVCPTAHPGPLVAAVLAPLVGVADEIVIAADSRVGAADLGAYASVADRVLRFEHAGANKQWPWLVEQARGRWLLMLDGDELVSEALVHALPELLEDRRVTQYSLPIHWPWRTGQRGDALKRLAAAPWSAERRLRLVRNDPRLLFHTGQHRLAEATAPLSYRNDLPVYHLDLLMPDLGRRTAKVAGYDADAFGMLMPDGRPFNRALYLPEHAPQQPLPMAAIPPADAERIERALNSEAPVGTKLEPANLPLTDRATILGLTPDAVLRDPQHGELRIVELPAFVAERPLHEVWVEVTNRGTKRWPGVVRIGTTVHVGVRWRFGEEPTLLEGERTPLPHALDPGETLLMPLYVRAPARTDAATTLILDLVDDERWYGNATTAAVSIQPSARTRLAALAAQHGPLLPLASVNALRRELGAIDALVPSREDQFAFAPSEPRLAHLTAGLPPGPRAVDQPTIDLLVSRVRELQPSAITAFGCGPSTIVLAGLLAEQGTPEARVLCIEQDPAWLGRTWERLGELGLQQWVIPIHALVGQASSGQPACYLLSDDAQNELRAHPPELVFVDGPVLAEGGSRLGTIDLVAPFIRDAAVILLDDAFGDAELTVGSAWAERPDVAVRGVHATPKGTLEAVLSRSRA